MRNVKSNYLKSEEWDAIVYLMENPYSKVDKSKLIDFQDYANFLIDRLLDINYSFDSMNSNDEFTIEVENNNTEKLRMLFFNDHHDALEVVSIFRSGRNFLLQHLPDLVGDDDTQFENAVTYLKNKLGLVN